MPQNTLYLDKSLHIKVLTVRAFKYKILKTIRRIEIKQT